MKTTVVSLISFGVILNQCNLRGERQLPYPKEESKTVWMQVAIEASH
jgi:hypothetical protein